MNSIGDAIVVWLQPEGNSDSVYVSRYDFAVDTWTTPAVVENLALPASDTRAVLDDNGNALVVWVQSDGVQPSIYAARYYDVLTDWGAPVLLESGDLGRVTEPHVALSKSGNAVAAWIQSDGIRDDVWAARFVVASNSWDTAVKLDTGNQSASAVRVEMDDVGDAVAVWVQSDGSVENIYSADFDSGAGTWGTPVLVDAATGAASDPAVSVNASGDAMVAWVQDDGIQPSAYAARKSASASVWGAPVLLENDDITPVRSTRVALADSGDALSAWVAGTPGGDISSFEGSLANASYRFAGESVIPTQGLSVFLDRTT